MPGLIWSGWKPATCLPDGCFCEAVRSGWIAQPANTWSSLVFVVVGVWVLASSSKKPNTYALVYGLGAIAIGVGSGFYHASLTLAGQVCDIAGMYVLATFMVLMNAGRLWPRVASLFAYLYVGLNVALLAAQVAFPGSRRYLFAAAILVLLILEYRLWEVRRGRIERKWLGWALAAMSVGFLVWTLDITRRVCNPQSLLQGHALWHLLGALSAWCVFCYYRSEREVARTTTT